jgi:hypothetical protein
MMYHHIASRLTDEGRVQLDAMLGDPAAMAEVAKNRRESASAAEFEVG